MSEPRTYFPIFYSFDAITAELSAEDFATIVRAALRKVPVDKRPEGFTDLQYITYKMLVDSAERVWSTSKKTGGDERHKKSPPKNSYQPDEIDPEEALRLALKRSFGDEEDF